MALRMAATDGDDTDGGEDKRAKRKEHLLRYLDRIVNLRKVSWNAESARSPEPAWDARAVQAPRVLWLYWHQGWESAPEVARVCLESWRTHNPGYDVRAIDYEWVKANYGDELSLSDRSGTQGFSDRLRLRLLLEHGGIWSDATIYCSQPLDAWIHALLTPSRFFAFAYPKADRMIATWFLVAAPATPLVEAWDDLLTRYFAHLARDDRNVHSYFFSHYAFEFIVTQSVAMRRWWDAMPKLAIAGVLQLRDHAGLRDLGSPERVLDEADYTRMRALLSESPLHRLTWKGAVRAGLPRARETVDFLAAELDRRDC